MTGKITSVLEDLKEKQDLIKNNSGTAQVPVARLDFLDSSGHVGDSKEYYQEAVFLRDLQEELYYGVPLVVVLYRDENGKTISKKFLEDLDTLPKGLKEEYTPAVQLTRTLEKGDLR